jgi:hypothetical protein
MAGVRRDTEAVSSPSSNRCATEQTQSQHVVSACFSTFLETIDWNTRHHPGADPRPMHRNSCRHPTESIYRSNRARLAADISRHRIPAQKARWYNATRTAAVGRELIFTDATDCRVGLELSGRGPKF